MNAYARLTLAVSLVAAACFLHADVLYNLPLPDQNVNGTAPSSDQRSNIAWGDVAVYDGYNWADGGDFTIGTAGQSYQISSLTVWLVGDAGGDPLNSIFSSLTLSGGTPGSASGSPACADITGPVCLSAGNIGTLATDNTDGTDPNLSVTSVNYPQGQDFQSTKTGVFKDLFQVTFGGLNWVVQGGTLYTFFVSGVEGTVGNGGVSPYLAASDMNLGYSSETAQESAADGLLWEFASDGPEVMDSWNSLTVGAWYQPTDTDVEIQGTQLPEPASASLLAIGFGLFAIARKLRKP